MHAPTLHSFLLCCETAPLFFTAAVGSDPGAGKHPLRLLSFGIMPAENWLLIRLEQVQPLYPTTSVREKHT